MKRSTKLPVWPPRIPNRFTRFRLSYLWVALLGLATVGALFCFIFTQISFVTAGSQVMPVRAGEPLASAILAPTDLSWQQNDGAERILKAGDVIFEKGYSLSPGELGRLRRAGLAAPAPPVRYLPVALLLLVAVGVYGTFLSLYCSAVFSSLRKLILLVSLLTITLWATMTAGAVPDLYELLILVTIPAGVMAIAGLLGSQASIGATILLCVTLGLTSPHPFSAVIIAMGSAFAGVMAIASIWPARRAVPAVLSLAAVNFILLVATASISHNAVFPPNWQLMGQWALWSAAGALGATFIAVGAIYICARPFGITTHYRLMELSKPTEPLLRKLMIEAPGTYHSSVMVSNIAEAAADAIGADSLLTSVAALYHDIGKLKRPGFFVENQAPLGVGNVHQRLSPKLSYLILASHVRDGVEIARRENLPIEIRRMISEHHGTTLAAYFYHRARSEGAGENLSEYEFRYPGPKPSTRESAVLMLSDSVQASVKSLKDPTPSRIKDMIDEIVNSRLEDGQFEECTLTLQDLHRMSEVFVRILTGLYTYTRLEYPDIKREGMRFSASINSAKPLAPRETSVASTRR